MTEPTSAPALLAAIVISGQTTTFLWDFFSPAWAGWRAARRRRMLFLG